MSLITRPGPSSSTNPTNGAFHMRISIPNHLPVHQTHKFMKASNFIDKWFCMNSKYEIHSAWLSMCVSGRGQLVFPSIPGLCEPPRDLGGNPIIVTHDPALFSHDL